MKWKSVTVMYSDIRDFTTIAESLPLNDLVEMLKEYISEMVSAVESTGGTVGDFIGDGIMIFWNRYTRLIDCLGNSQRRTA